MITGKQIKAARVLLDWKQNDLAERLGMSVTNVKRIEGGGVVPPKTLANLIEVFSNAGIIFTPNGGVEIRDDLVRILEGKDGFIDFFNEVYNYTRKNGGEIIVRDVDDRKLHNVLGDVFEDHPERMQKLGNFTCRTIVREGDNYSDKHEYASFAKVPDELFSNVPLYVFGHFVAIFFWKENPKIMLINDADLAMAYKKQFDFVWKSHTDGEVS